MGVSFHQLRIIESIGLFLRFAWWRALNGDLLSSGLTSSMLTSSV